MANEDDIFLQKEEALDPIAIHLTGVAYGKDGGVEIKFIDEETFKHSIYNIYPGDDPIYHDIEIYGLSFLGSKGNRMYNIFFKSFSSPRRRRPLL